MSPSMFGNKGMSVQLGKPLFRIVQSCGQLNKSTVESSIVHHRALLLQARIVYTHTCDDDDHYFVLILLFYVASIVNICIHQILFKHYCMQFPNTLSKRRDISLEFILYSIFKLWPTPKRLERWLKPHVAQSSALHDLSPQYLRDRKSRPP